MYRRHPDCSFLYFTILGLLGLILVRPLFARTSSTHKTSTLKVQKKTSYMNLRLSQAIC